MRKRVAIIIPGGVGTGLFNQGIPALMNLIDGLSLQLEITVYSLVAVSPNFKASHFEIKAIEANHDDWILGRVIRLIRMIMKDHRKKQYDLFHGFWGIPCGTMAVVLGKLFKRPSVVSLQGGEAACLKQIKYGYLISQKKKRRLFKTLNVASHVTALTNFQRDELRRHGFGGKEIEVIPYGVDTTKFCPTQKDYDDPLQFIHVANASPIKDQKTLLKSFGIIKDHINCHLKIVGPDDHNLEIQTLCKQYDLKDAVTTTGPIPNSELPKHIMQAHIMLHTSLYEAQAVAVVEAMACQVLVAGTEIGILSDLAEYAVTSPVGDFEQLAKAVLDIVRRPDVMREKIDKAFEWTRSNDIEATVAKFSRIYERLIAQ